MAAGWNSFLTWRTPISCLAVLRPNFRPHVGAPGRMWEELCIEELLQPDSVVTVPLNDSKVQQKSAMWSVWVPRQSSSHLVCLMCCMGQYNFCWVDGCIHCALITACFTSPCTSVYLAMIRLLSSHPQDEATFMCHIVMKHARDLTT